MTYEASSMNNILENNVDILKSMPNEAMRETITTAYRLYLELIVIERNNHSHARHSVIESPH